MIRVKRKWIGNMHITYDALHHMGLVVLASSNLEFVCTISDEKKFFLAVIEYGIEWEHFSKRWDMENT